MCNIWVVFYSPWLLASVTVRSIRVFFCMSRVSRHLSFLHIMSSVSCPVDPWIWLSNGQHDLFYLAIFRDLFDIDAMICSQMCEHVYHDVFSFANPWSTGVSSCFIHAFVFMQWMMVTHHPRFTTCVQCLLYGLCDHITVPFAEIGLLFSPSSCHLVMAEILSLLLEIHWVHETHILYRNKYLYWMRFEVSAILSRFPPDVRVRERKNCNVNCKFLERMMMNVSHCILISQKILLYRCLSSKI